MELYFKIIFYGIIAGTILSFGFGTVFFALIQNSINYGYRKGVAIASGVLVSDIIFVLISVFGTQMIDDIQQYKQYIKIVGGISLIILGIYQLVPKKVNNIENGTVTEIHFMVFFTKGFLLNFMNPINFFSWLGIQINNSSVLGYNTYQSLLFFLFALGTIFLFESLISYSANFFGKNLSPNILKIVNYIMGYVFIILGLVLIFKKI